MFLGPALPVREGRLEDALIATLERHAQTVAGGQLEVHVGTVMLEPTARQVQVKYNALPFVVIL